MQLPKRSALYIAAKYALVAAAWILLSDLFVSRFESPSLVTILSVAKGWSFVLVTAFLLYVIIKRDINRILHTEAQMSLLFNSVSDGIYIMRVSDDGRIDGMVDVNEAALKQLGYRREEIQKLFPYEIVQDGFRDRAREMIEQLIKVGEAVFPTCLVTKQGEEFPAEVSARTIRFGQSCLAICIVRDITERRNAEEERQAAVMASERDKRRFYKETVLALTEGKFELGDPGDIDTWFSGREYSAKLGGPQDLAKIRHALVHFCRQKGLSEDESRDFELAVGEALGNAVKHAGGGHVYAGKHGDNIWIAVVDNGPGIDTFALPKVALLMGFTTKASMGLGYTVILEVCDHVKLATGPSGTTVVMEKSLVPQSEFEKKLAMHKSVE